MVYFPKRKIFCDRCKNPNCRKPLRGFNKSGFCSSCAGFPKQKKNEIEIDRKEVKANGD